MGCMQSKSQVVMSLIKRIESSDPNCTSIELRNALINDEVVAKLAYALQINSVVADIVLNRNEIGPPGARALSNMLVESIE